MANILFFSHLVGFDILSGADKVLLNIAAHQPTPAFWSGSTETRCPSNCFRLGWRKSFGIPETAPVAAFLGTIMHHKGVYEFIQMAREVADAIPEAKFVICGNQHLDQGYTDFLEQAVGNLGVEEKVIFAGYYEDIGKFLPGIDVLVVPSINREPFGMQ